jgi:HD-like signal output (HDOD) protein
MSIVSPAQQGATALQNVMDRVTEISALPDVALRVIEVTNNDDASAADLKAVMEQDVSLSARVLRVVNSSAYGLREPVRNLQLAIAYLGFRQVRNLALTASVCDLFKADEQVGRYRRSGLWRHLVAVGICARMIAMRRNLDEFEDVFLAGLLHDIGILLEDQYDHPRFIEMLPHLDGSATLAEVERARLGYAHTDLGVQVGAQWRFPEPVLAAIGYHHDAQLDVQPHVRTIACVQVANMLCSHKGIASVGINLVRPAVSAVHLLKLNKSDLTVLLVDLDEELARHDALFNL